MIPAQARVAIELPIAADATSSRCETHLFHFRLQLEAIIPEPCRQLRASRAIFIDSRAGGAAKIFEIEASVILATAKHIHYY